MAGPIRVLVVDDHPMVRGGIVMILDGEPGIEVTGEAADGVEAIEQALRLRPDVVLLDLQMPRVDGFEAMRQILRALPETRIIILTTYETDGHIFQGLKLGAQSYLLKDSPPERLIEAVRAVQRGESPIAPRVASRMLERLRRTDSRATHGDALSAREVEVLQKVATGATNRQIAAQLYLSENTVKAHLMHVYAKLEVRGRTQAVAEARRRGILDP